MLGQCEDSRGYVELLVGILTNTNNPVRAWCGVRGYGDAGARSGARGGSTLRRERPAAAAHQPSGPSGAFKRPSRFPMQIGFLWCFCMGAQGG